MSKLAAELPNSEFTRGPFKGPRSSCYLVYGECDVEDLAAVKDLRDQGLTWNQIQESVDKILGIEDHLPTKRFIYHWRELCACWRNK